MFDNVRIRILITRQFATYPIKILLSAHTKRKFL
jgi:hypothetical protein